VGRAVPDTHYGLSTATAAGMTSLVLDRVGARRSGHRRAVRTGWASASHLPRRFGGLAFVGWIIVTFVEDLPLAGLAAVLIVIGLASAAVMIGFALVKETVPPSLAGTAGGFTNMGNMLGGMLLQPAVGWVLDRMWSGETVNGVRVFDLDAYAPGSC
jgi:MFS family permease